MSGRVSVVAVIVDTLLARVVAGAYRPGGALPAEAWLAEDLEVSRLTVREAVKVLVARGILRSRQGSGTYVVDPDRWTDLAGLLMLERARRDEREVGLALLEVRRMLEVGSAGLAAARRTPDQLDAMGRSIGDLRRAHQRDDVEAAARADLDFHDLLIHAAGNPLVVGTYAPLREELMRARLVTSAHPEVRSHAIEQHERILFALRAGSPDAAKAAMRAHMEQTSNDLLSRAPVVPAVSGLIEGCDGVPPERPTDPVLPAVPTPRGS
ncbi:FadR/GntR family transcriptional regulator [Actinomyces timonensis]|uniref:FadR/GntR family transcriptional regulator n=1 Tax=Actinomyces timonensis TaxID=1288391 RepID=A0AAU8N4S6_9ACTO